MAQQTAVEWLQSKLDNELIGEIPFHRWHEIREAVRQAKQMEKEQIMNAWRNGDNDSMYPPQELDRQAEEHYNETYGKE